VVKSGGFPGFGEFVEWVNVAEVVGVWVVTGGLVDEKVRG